MTCACVSDDRYECWARRYGMGMAFRCDEIDADGGPCECDCHDAEDGYEFSPHERTEGA